MSCTTIGFPKPWGETFRVIQLVISKTKFRSVSPERKLRSDPGFRHISTEDVPCPSSPSHGFLHHTI
jgi:hypothetical protein